MKRFRSLLILLAVMPSLLNAQTKTLQARPRYTLRPGDTIHLQYRLTPELNQTVSIQPDGYVDLELVGEVHIGGLTVKDAHDLIVSAASKRLNNPDLNLVLEEFTRPYVVVAGEVAKPGQIELRENMSALSAIMLSGGLTANAQSRQVIIFRKLNDSISEVKQLNLSHFRNTSILEHDLALQAGDIVLVPRDRLSRFQHIIQTANIGLYVNPLQNLAY